MSVTLLDDYRTGQRCPWRKRRSWTRKASGVDTILVHATAVKGGFGVSSQIAETVRGLARRARYRETPYHGVYSPRDRVSVVQWSATELTYHGNAPNVRSLGWAYDGKFTPAESDDLDVEGGRASLRHLIARALEQGCPIKQVAPHANHAPPPRHAKPHDPGPRVWLDVVVPVAAEFGLVLALDWTTGGAEPWAKRWMEVAA